MPTAQSPTVLATVLATDLDGTFIPLEGCPENVRDLRLIVQRLAAGLELVFVTGRHFDSVLQAIDQFSLPIPKWIICDVGTSIYQRNGESFQRVAAYQAFQSQITAAMPQADLKTHLASFDQLRVQEAEKQGPYKLSYYVDATELKAIREVLQQLIDRDEIPYDIIASVDPFNGDGLIDFLPKGVSKACAIDWWANHVGVAEQAVVFAGDSGNDFAALTAGYRAVLVGNADRELATRVQASHQEKGWIDRLHLAKANATSGVLEGLNHFNQQSA